MRSTFAVRESASFGIMGAPEVPPLCRETQSLGQQMLNAPLGINGLKSNIGLNYSTNQDIFKVKKYAILNIQIKNIHSKHFGGGV